MSTRVEPWGARRSDQPQCVVHADVGAAAVLDSIAGASAACGLRVHRVPGGLDAVRGMTGGYLVSEIVQLPLMTALARVEVQVRVLDDAPGGSTVAVTCVTGAGELGAGAGQVVGPLGRCGGVALGGEAEEDPVGDPVGVGGHDPQRARRHGRTLGTQAVRS